MLGALFRSQRFQNKETELVIFVTPTVVDAHSPGLVDRVQKINERLQQRLGEPPHLSEPLQPGHEPAQAGAVGDGAGVALPEPPQPTATVGAALTLRQLPLSDVELWAGADGTVLRLTPDINASVLVRLRRGEPMWRETGDGHGTTLIATEAGLESIGIEPLAASAVASARKAKATAEPAPDDTDTAKPVAIRAGTKQAQIIAMLQRPEGATVAEMVETPEVESAVRAAGVDFGQGWFYGRPSDRPEAPERRTPAAAPAASPRSSSSTR